MMFKTTESQKAVISQIETAMNQDSSLSLDFIKSAVKAARTDQGVFDLLTLWSEATTPDDKADTIKDLQQMVKEVNRREGKEI